MAVTSRCCLVGVEEEESSQPFRYRRRAPRDARPPPPPLREVPEALSQDVGIGEVYLAFVEQKGEVLLWPRSASPRECHFFFKDRPRQSGFLRRDDADDEPRPPLP